MLAERRRKQKWSLNPRGTLWSSDSNKFGQRLLEKMGWKAGCGLGANLQGPTEHVRVSVKTDNRGVGFKGRAEDVLEHQMNFSKLLEELNGGVKEKVKVKSLEHQSQQSRARVHYRKFTRGKDLSRCSDKDLQCILGKKMNEAEVEQNYFDNQESIKNFGVLTIDGGNSDEYFQNKLGNKLDSKTEKDCVHESHVEENLMWKSKKRKIKKKKNSGACLETEESEVIGNNLTAVDKVSSPVADTSHNLNKSINYKKKLKSSRVQKFVSQIELEHEETEAEENFSTCFVEKNRKEKRGNDSERLKNVTDSEEVGSRNKCKLDRRNDKKRKVREIKLCDDEVQDATVKKKKKNKTCNLSVAVKDDITKPEESGDFEDTTIPKTYDHLSLKDNSEQDTVYKKKSKKKKRKASEKELEVCENKEPGEEEILQEKVTTGIRKGPAVTDLGFKGSNIMHIKGYGVA